MDDFAILFCRPGPGSTLEDCFELEADVVDALGIETHVINADLVVDGEAELAAEAIVEGAGPALYRGPILSAEEYEALYDALLDRGAQLIVDPRNYEHALYVPEHHEAIADLAPPTRWTYGVDLGEAWEAACELGDPPWLIKDHVKSAKEGWEGACFVPAGASRRDFEEVASALIDLRAERFERELIELRARFVEPEDAKDRALWSLQLIEYINAHPEIGSYLQERRFHICRAHRRAREVLVRGVVSPDFICPLRDVSCPFESAVELGAGRAIVLSPRRVRPEGAG